MRARCTTRQPGSRRRRSTSPASTRSTPPWPSARAAFPAWRATSLSRRAEVMFRFRELVDANRKEIAALLTAEHGKVLTDALGEVARGLENVEFACGIPHLLKGGYSRAGGDRRRRLLDPPAARRRRRHHPVQLPGDGADVDVRQRPRVRQHVRAQAEREGPVGVAVPRRAARHGRPARRVLQRRARRQGRRRPASSSTPTSPPSASSARRRSPGTSTRPGTTNGKRVQALGGAKNHMLVLPDADLDMAADAAVSAGYGSAGERCMAISVVLASEAIADELVAKIAERIPVDQGRSGQRARQRDGPADHRRAPRQGARLRRRRGRTRARPSSSTAATTCPAEGFFLKPTLLDNVAPGTPAYDDEIFGPVLGVVRVHGYDEALAPDQRQPVRQRRRHLHPRRRGGPAVPVRRQRRHGRRQRADPGAGQLLQLRRVEVEPVRRHAHVRPGGHQLLHPRQGRHEPLARPRDEHHRPRLPRRTDDWSQLGVRCDRDSVERAASSATRPLDGWPWTRWAGVADDAAVGACRRPRQAGRDLRVQPRLDVRQPHPVAGALRHLQPDPRRDPQHRRRADGHQPGDPGLDGDGERVRHAQRDVRQPHGVRHRPRRLGGAGHQRQADVDRHAARVGARHPRARQRPGGRVQGLDAALPVGDGEPARGVDRRLRAAGAGARPARSATGSSSSSPTPTSRRGRSKRSAKRRSKRAATPAPSPSAWRRRPMSATIVGPRPRPVPLVRRDGRQPRRRHRRPLRRVVAPCPRRSPTTSRDAPATTTTSTARPATCTRSSCPTTSSTASASSARSPSTSAASTSCASSASTSSPSTSSTTPRTPRLQAYGEHVIPALAEHVRAKA